MRYLDHFPAVLRSILFAWVFLLVVGLFVGFENGWWLLTAGLVGVVVPIMLLFGGLRTALRRWQWRHEAFSAPYLPMMYHRGTEKLDADGQPVLTRRGEPVLAQKPRLHLRHACCVALLSPHTLVLCRAAQHLCHKPEAGIPWSDLDGTLATVPVPDWRGVTVTLCDAEEVRQAQAADLSNDAFFTALLALTWRMPNGTQRRAVFAFTQDEGKAPVREALASMLTRAGLPLPERLQHAGEDKLLASQGVAEAVAVYLRAWAD
ncbi:MAG: hypothetical protein LAT61_15570 [Alcanivorax sp.]|nr:hypothetical protein [Alcanivorax sp.]